MCWLFVSCLDLNISWLVSKVCIETVDGDFVGQWFEVCVCDVQIIW